jgi:rod shape determining protein RodA
MERAQAIKLKRTRLALFALASILTVIGIFFIHSTTGNGEPFPSRSARGQILKGAFALLALFAIGRVDYRWLERHAYAIYAVLISILVVMLGVKLSSGGNNRFIEFDRLQLQPSELMKIGLVLALARYLRFREDQRRVRGLVGPFILTIVPMALVLLQPDLGTSLMFPPVLLGMLFVAGAKPRHLSLALFLGLLLLPAAYFLGDRIPFLKEYQRDRIMAYVKRDETTARGKGFQLRQSEIAIGSGGLTGKGFGEGTQNTLRYLPEKHTDFIYSIISEELGFAGAASVVVFFLLLVLLILKVAVYTREPFGRLAVTGIGVAFAAQSFENLGMTMGLTPITGIPLPFVSLGGSSLLTSFLFLGIALNIASRPVRVVATRDLDPSDRKKILAILEDKPAGLLQSRWPVE